MHQSSSTFIRLTLAGVAGLYCLLQLPVALMVFGHRSGQPGLAERTDGATAGDSVHRFTPLIEQMSTVQVGAGFVQIALYAVAAVALACRWRRTPWVFGVALGVQAGQQMAMRALPAYPQTWTANEQVQDILVLATMALIAVASHWLTRARQPQAS